MRKQLDIIRFNLLVSTLLASSQLLGQVYFQDVAVPKGIVAPFGTGLLGGGVSLCDIDGNGWDDITLATEAGKPCRIFLNEQGNFTPTALNGITDLAEQKQVLWVDYDNDGDKDFFCTSHSGLNVLYRQEAPLQFVDVTATVGLDTSNHRTFGASWGDYDNDGWLDLFLSYRNIGGSAPNRLYRNRGDGTFEDVTVAAGLNQTVDPSFCAAFLDYNRDGFQDIYIANDRFTYPNVLYRNNGNGTFSDVGAAAGADLLMAAMSVTVGDYNNDGWPDIYCTNVFNPTTPGVVQTNALLRNNQDGTFSEVAQETGTEFNSIGWGAVFLDAENDRDLDLYVSGMQTEPPMLPAAFYENQNSTFTIPNDAGFEDDRRVSFANAVGDIDNDGFPEILVSNEVGDLPFLWHNQSTSNNQWLKLVLEGVQSNRDGIGSTIEISIDGESQFRFLRCGEGYLGQNSNQILFGLGDAAVVDYVKIQWPSGQTDIIEQVGSNQKLAIREGTGLVASKHPFQPTTWKIFPNPVDNTLFIKNLPSSSHVNLLDAYGHILQQYKSQGPEMSISSFSKLKAGIYFLQIETTDDVSTQKLIVK